MQLTDVLRGGRQCDEDGVEIIMSRQACHEAADEIERLRGLVLRQLRWQKHRDSVGCVMSDAESSWIADADAAMTPNADVTGLAPEGDKS